MDSKEFPVLIKYCFLVRKNGTQAKERLDECYGTYSLLYKTVKKWYTEFKCDHTSIDNAEHSGRQNEAVTEENIKKLHRIVLDDRQIEVLDS